MLINRKVLCIIPARGGSKGVLKKNLRFLNGKPLLYYVAHAAKESRYIGEVYVSTDDDEINAYAVSLGVKVIDRPGEFATDDAVSEDAVLHALDEIGNERDIFDAVCVFAQATSPLTLPVDLDRLVECMKEGKDSAAFYVNDYGHFFELDDMMRVRVPRQQRNPRKREAGNAWAFRIDGFFKYRSRLFGNVGMIEIEEPRHLEIDTQSDFDLIECIMRKETY